MYTRELFMLSLVLVSLACGPEVSEPSPALRVLYPTAEGIVARDVVEGELGEPQVVAPGRWESLSVDGSRFSATDVDGTQFLFGEGVETFEVGCPVEQGCWVASSTAGWLLSERIVDPLQDTNHYVVTNAEPELLYTSTPMSFGGVAGDALLATPENSRLVRVPIVPGGTVEELYDAGAPFDLRVPTDSGLALLLSPSELIWIEDLAVLDLTSPGAGTMTPPLLPGRTAYGIWTAGGVIHDDGLFLIQGESDGTRVADVAWVGLRDGVAAEPVLVSTGEIERKIEFTANFNPIIVSPAGSWVALRTRVDSDGPSGTHLVPRAGDAFGAPIALGASINVVRFSADDDAVFYWSFEEDAVAFHRTQLSGQALGSSEVLLELDEPHNASFSDDGSTVVVSTFDEGTLRLIDLKDDPPVVRVVPECAGENVGFQISSDGSLVACSSGEDRTEGRSHALVHVRTGEVVPLPDATDTVRFGGA